jgi:hypothetical protein
MVWSTIEDHGDVLIFKLGRDCIKEYLHADGIHIRKNKVGADTIFGAHGTVKVSILAYSLSRDCGTNRLGSPAGTRRVDTPETRFILEHHTQGNFPFSGVTFSFLD